MYVCVYVCVCGGERGPVHYRVLNYIPALYQIGYFELWVINDIHLALL